MRTRFGIILVACVLFLFAGSAVAAEFSGVSVDTLPASGQGPMTGKIFIKGDKIRRDMSMQGMSQSMIMRLDKKLVWTLLPDQKMYMESKTIRELDKPLVEAEAKKEAEVVKLGKETVNGYVCEKVQYIFHDKAKGKATTWVAEKLAYPIKMVVDSPQGSMTSEIRDIKEGGVADSLFEVPPGFSLMRMPSLPGGMKFPTPK
jgi:hypothetical protein